MTESPQRRRGGAGEPRDRDGGGGDGENEPGRHAENRLGPRPERRIPDLESQAARQTRKPFSPEHSGEGSQPVLEKQQQPCFCGKKEEGSPPSLYCVFALSRAPHWRPRGLQPAGSSAPGCSRQESWRGLRLLLWGSFPRSQGSSPPSPAPAGGFFITEPPGTPPTLSPPGKVLMQNINSHVSTHICVYVCVHICANKYIYMYSYREEN